jgi:pimeloyl-ACP methyl ester carboxylesterase
MREEGVSALRSGLNIAYRIDGPIGGEPVLLVAGLGLDLTSWRSSFVTALVREGLRVISFDNRDAGRSSAVEVAAPGRVRQLFARPAPHDYTVEEMAGDARGLLDELEIDRCDVVGMSMGGMIAQALASTAPARVRTLTSIFSTTGNRKVGQPAYSTILRMGGPAPRSANDYAKSHVSMLRHIAGEGFHWDEATEREWAGEAWSRMGSRAVAKAGAGTARQIAAINKSGDRTRDLSRITAPTLVIHGKRDLMVHTSGGLATASAITGSRFIQIDRLGHHLPDSASGTLAELICEHRSRRRSAPSSE